MPPSQSSPQRQRRGGRAVRTRRGTGGVAGPHKQWARPSIDRPTPRRAGRAGRGGAVPGSVRSGARGGGYAGRHGRPVCRGGGDLARTNKHPRLVIHGERGAWTGRPDGAAKRVASRRVVSQSWKRRTEQLIAFSLVAHFNGQHRGKQWLPTWQSEPDKRLVHLIVKKSQQNTAFHSFHTVVGHPQTYSRSQQQLSHGPPPPAATDDTLHRVCCVGAFNTLPSTMKPSRRLRHKPHSQRLLVFRTLFRTAAAAWTAIAAADAMKDAMQISPLRRP